MAVLAVKSAKLTNSRGFCVELSAAMTVILASRFGLPVSTTMIACGAILTIGLMEGAQGVNWRLALRIFVGWVSFVVAVFRGKKKQKKHERHSHITNSRKKLFNKTFSRSSPSSSRAASPPRSRRSASTRPTALRRWPRARSARPRPRPPRPRRPLPSRK